MAVSLSIVPRVAIRGLSFLPNIFSPILRAFGPDMRTMPTPLFPGGVAIATMVVEFCISLKSPRSRRRVRICNLRLRRKFGICSVSHNPCGRQ